MTASVVEVISSTTASTAHAVAITTALVPGDLVVCISSTYNTTNTHITPSGLGAWSDELSGLSGGALDAGMRVHTLAGVTGAGSITLSQPSAGSRYVILVISGLDLPVLAARDVLSITSSVQTSAFLTAHARENAVVVTVSHFASGTPGNPASATPASGWISDWNTSGAGNTAISVSHNMLTTSQVVEATLTGGASSIDAAVGLFVFGTPLETRVHGEYVSAIHDGSGVQPGRAVQTGYIEAISNDAAVTPRAMQAEYLEALSTEGPGTARNGAEYAEVLHDIPPGAIASNRVAALNVESLSQALPTALVRAENVEVLATLVPPAADAAIYGAETEVLVGARTAEVGSVYVEALRRYVVPGPGGGGRRAGWGIAI